MRVWDNERKALLLSLRADGMALGDIAREMGVSRAAISGQFHRMGLNRRAVKPTSPRGPRPALGPQSRRCQDLKPSKTPFAPDHTCPDFAHDDLHCEAVNAAGGFGVMPRRAA